jgi:hypothetical protein
MSFWQIIGAAWRDAIGAIRRNSLIFLVVFLVLSALMVGFDYFVPPLHHALATGPHLHRVARSTPYRAILGLIEDIISSIIVVPLMVSVHRFVLLGKYGETLNDPKRLLFFALYLVFINIMSELPGEIEGVLQPQSSSQIFLLIMTIIAWIITVRLLLAYPAAALDKPSPLLDSWVRTRGHWWYITTVMICGWLPLLLIGIATITLAFHHGFKTPVFGIGHVLDILFSTLASVLFIALGAALVSELYLKFDGLEELRATPFVRGSGYSKDSKRPMRSFNIVIIVGVVVLAQIAYHVFPKSSVDHVEGVILVICLVPILLLVFFLFYFNLKKRFRSGRGR